MRALFFSLAAGAILLAANQGSAQQAGTPPTTLPYQTTPAAKTTPGSLGISIAPYTQGEAFFEIPELTGQDKDKDKGKGKDKGKEKIEPKQPEDALARAEEEGARATRGREPHVIGDIVGVFALKTIMLPATQFINSFQTVTTSKTVTQITIVNGVRQITTTQVPVTSQVFTTTQQQTVVSAVTRVPVAGLGGSLKIGENQSPMPEDRVYLTYNYYDHVRGSNGTFAVPSNTTQQTTINGLPASITTVVPGAPSPAINVHRGLFGIEKTFLDGNASVGLRLPVFDARGDGTFSQSDIGDLGVFFNYAFYRDNDGNVLSGGLMVTVPSGPRVDTQAGDLHPTWLQPFFGYRLNAGDFYVQGFTSVAIPTQSQVPTILFNDIGFGYWLYRGNGDGLVSSVIPAFEVHVTTPLDHRQATDPITVPDIVALTGGVHFGLGRRAMFTLGVVTPVTGPRPWGVEAVAQFNLRF